MNESRHMLNSILTNANEAVFILQNARIKYMNPAVSEIMGYSDQELIHTHFIEIIHGTHKTLVVNNYKKRINGEQVPQNYSFRIYQK